MTKGTKKKFWYFLDHLAGDKVVWMILLMLMLLSIVFIFSSSSRLTTENTTRLDIMIDHIKVVGLGLTLVIFIYNIKDIEFFRKCSRFGFWISFILLLLLYFIGDEVNGAVRFITIAGFQIHVFEIVKVAMMMYIAWAIDALENNRTLLVENIPFLKGKLKFLKKPVVRQVLMLYFPFIATIPLVMHGSNSAALFISVIMIITIAVGTNEIKRSLILTAILVTLITGAYCIYSNTKNTSHPRFERIGTALGRIFPGNPEKEYKLADNAIDKQKALDKLRQPFSAKLAIKQGGILGKGPGQSTQRYVVPDMSEDYMFSFIVEEYGLLSFFVVMLYLSLLARGTLIIKSCTNNLFAKSAIFGLVILISGQAFLHIAVNMDWILTGQTLPMLSHGSFAFICFSIAFGIILSISRIANKGMAKLSKEAAPILETEPSAKDNISEGLSDLDNFETDGIQTN